MPAVGFRIWYADGAVYAGVTDADWVTAPSATVQVVAVYEDREYQVWQHDQWETERYLHRLSREDYYWAVPSKDLYGCGPTAPPDLPPGAIKTGSTLSKEDWLATINRAEQARTL